jgi:molybdopterin-binding protein
MARILDDPLPGPPPEYWGREAKGTVDRFMHLWCAAFGSAKIIRTMALSARNQFRGKVLSIQKSAVMCEVVIDIGGGNKIVSLISASSAKRLGLKKGSPAVAVIKATEVIVSTDLSDSES